MRINLQQQKVLAMEKNVCKWWLLPLPGLLYLVAVFASCFVGFLHPVCWAYFSVLAALLACWPYVKLASKWKRFGAGSCCSLLVCIFCLLSGEAGGVLSKAVILGFGILSDIVRAAMGNSTRRGVIFAYPVLAIGNIGWIIRLWTEPQWYYDGAVSEMGQAYADGISALQTPAHLVGAIVLTATVAIVSVWACLKVDRRIASELK